jgi:hypothetical protein
MRQRFTPWFSLLTVCLMLAVYSTTAQAALLDVGPTVPQVLNSSPPQHGFPLWYRDTNRVPLEVCLSTALSPTVPGAFMCSILPTPGFNPAVPMAFTGNFPDELFYWTGDARLRGAKLVNGAQSISFDAQIIMALEGAFPSGAVTPGDQGTFARIRIIIDTVIPGTYRVIHPYGVNTFVITQADINATNGSRPVFYTDDIGLAAGGNFTGALQGLIGPFLIWDSGAPITVGTEQFIGDPSVAHTVTGSPFGTNILRVEGPVGSNLDGLGNDFMETNLFNVSGKIYPQIIPTPLKVNKAIYARGTGQAYVGAFATTQPLANATNPLAPFPGNFLLTGVPSSLQLTGVGIPTSTMATKTPTDGNFFSFSGLFPDPGTFPATIRVTNTADIPDTAVDVPLVDEITVNQAIYRPLTKTLTIAASSSDKVTPSELQAFMPGMAAPLGTLVAGQLGITFPITDSSVTPSKTYQIPPISVTVRSAKGGEITVPVVALDLAP